MMVAPGKSDCPKVGVVRVSEADMQVAIHALYGIFTVLSWIENEATDVGDQEQREVRGSLVIAGTLITDDFKRRL